MLSMCVRNKANLLFGYQEISVSNSFETRNLLSYDGDNNLIFDPLSAAGHWMLGNEFEISTPIGPTTNEINIFYTCKSFFHGVNALKYFLVLEQLPDLCGHGWTNFRLDKKEKNKLFLRIICSF